HDSQTNYQAQLGELGPGCAAYIWNRWDNYTYGPADTWTTFHWGDGHPWAGYQPRAYNAAARCWYELVVRGKEVPPELVEYVENWAKWLVGFLDRFDNHTPNEFPTAPNKPV
ncbi:phage tail protein, partial [Salmonella enterica subsp. enterica serovar Derby]|nr:phage tail protein [Salmonella enterica subsp. enterica serovar Derby]